MKIVFFGGDKQWEAEEIKKRLFGQELLFIDKTVNKSDLTKVADADIVSIFVDSKLGEVEFAKLPNVKLIAARSTGYDHIDLASAKAHGIAVVNVPTYGENTVAEYAFALLLCLSRKVYEAIERVRNTGSFSQAGLEGFDLMGKTLGVVGTGHIGLHAIKIGKGFGMNVIAFDVKQNTEEATKLGFLYVSMDELLAQSDIVTLHAPYNPHTHHMMGKEQFAKMKKGAYLVNTARGGLVDTESLVLAIKEGRLAGAALDVLEGESDIKDDSALLASAHPDELRLKLLEENRYLMKNPRVLIAPHNAFNTREAITRILEVTVQNIEAFTAGTPINVVP